VGHGGARVSGGDDGTGERRPAGEAGWYLETLEGGALRRHWIHGFPFRIGRRQGLEMVLPSESVSKLHAEIYAVGSDLRLRDLGSRNGTFLNRTLVEEEVAVDEGDIVHFAEYEFRLGRSEEATPLPAVIAEDRPTTAVIDRRELPHRFVVGTRELRELLRDGLVTAVFQPIVLLSRGTVAAYEALGRGRHPQLPENPLELLHIAETIHVEAELSRLFRKTSVELAAQRPGLPTVFLNTHPIEFARPGLLESLEEIRAIAPQLDLALEIHESVLTRPATIAELRAMLLERNIALAYDDFGAEQTRLEPRPGFVGQIGWLAEAPPHYLKFDRRFIHELDQAPAAKRRLLQSLLSLARDLLVKTVAEGIESAAEARACAELGFTHGQGFHIGRPRPIERL
jgi:EAL domain-containing protein (putative c-di-GMP-specific phosphodiesterase class I)